MLQRREDKIEFDIISYSIERPKKVDLYTMSTLIYMFETRVREVMLMSDELVTFDLELMRIILIIQHHVWNSTVTDGITKELSNIAMTMEMKPMSSQ